MERLQGLRRCVSASQGQRSKALSASIPPRVLARPSVPDKVSEQLRRSDSRVLCLVV